MKVKFNIILLKIIFGVYFSSIVHAQDTLLIEHFNTTAIPAGWTEEKVKGKAGSNNIVNWQFLEGGYNYSPDTAAGGDFNARFHFQSSNREATKLVTPVINSSGKIKPVLKFWHAQTIWYWGADYWDELVVYYKTGVDSAWVLLEEYPNAVPYWVEREILLPEDALTETLYVGFEGITGYGNGVCIDEVTICESGLEGRFVSNIKVSQPALSYVPTGTNSNPILRLDILVEGNNNVLPLKTLEVTSLNEDDYDIATNGVKLYYTKDSVFNTAVPLSSGETFSSGKVLFESLNYNLPTGNNYIWVTYDLKEDAQADHKLDAMLAKNIMQIGDNFYPDSIISPEGNRLIYQTIFFDNFETDQGWSFSYEFERNKPQGLGGYSGPKTWGSADPEHAVSGDTIIGVDLIGHGDYPGNYELNDTTNFHYATSPLLDLRYYNNVQLKFSRQLNIYLFDQASIQYSIDNGSNWNYLWMNIDEGGSISEPRWVERQYFIKDYVDRKDSVRIRFALGPTGAYNSSGGWNIDNFLVTGNFVTRDVGVAGWHTPNETCGLGDNEIISVIIKNYGSAPSPDTIPVICKFGASVFSDTLFGSIPPEDSVIFSFSEKIDLSIPNYYDDVQAYTSLEGDEDDRNDKFVRTFYSLPYINLPYADNFENTFSFWRENGDTSSFTHGVPNGFSLKNSHSGSRAWVTDLYNYYPEGDSSWIVSPCFNFSNVEKPIFDFFLWTEAEDTLDGLLLEYSIDDGTNWQKVPGHEYTYDWEWYNDTVLSLASRGWTGLNDTWNRHRQVLPDILEGQSSVKFRFLFSSNDSNTYYEGVGIDDIKVYEAPHDIGIISIDSLQTDCQFANEDKIWVSAKNFGLRALNASDTLIMGLKVNSDTVLYDTLQIGAIWPVGDTLSFQFTTGAPIQEAGIYELEAFTLIEADPYFYSDTANDTASFTFSVLPNPITNLPDSVFSAFPDTLFLVARDDPDYAYLWGTGETTNTFDVPAEGTYTLITTDTAGNGCITYDTTIVETLIPDIGIDSLINPYSNCALGSSELMTVQVRNFGTDTMHIGRQIITGFTYLTFTKIDTFELTQTLPPNGKYHYTFTDISIDMSGIGNYDFTAWTTNFLDSIPENDTLRTTVEVFGFPTVDLGPDTVVKDTTYLIDAGAGFDHYLWNDSSVAQTYYADTSGYHGVRVTDENGCMDTDSVLVFLKIRDVKPIQLVTPVTQCDYGTNEYLRVRIENAGTDTIPSGYRIPLAYKLNQLPVTRDTLELPNTILPGQNEVATFLSPLPDIADSTLIFNFYTELSEDLRLQNDTLTDTVYFYEPPIVSLGPDTVVRDTSYLITLQSEPSTTYNWNTGASNDSLEINFSGSYWVQAIDQTSCVSHDTISVILVFPDIGIIPGGITASCARGQNEPVKVNVVNFGTDTLKTGESIGMGYGLNGNHINETLVFTDAFLPGDTLEYTFTQAADLATQEVNEISLYTGYSYDLDRTNDTLKETLYEFPVINLGPDTVVRGTSYLLSFEEKEGSVYSWNTGSTNDSLIVENTGTYWATAISANNCTAADTVFVNLVYPDVGITSSAITSSCDKSNAEDIEATLTNFGTDTLKIGESISLGYQINNNTPVTDQVEFSQDIIPGDSILFTFNSKADLSEYGIYNIKIYTLYNYDLDRTNDTLKLSAGNYETPEVSLEAPAVISEATYTLDAGYNENWIYEWQDSSNAQTYTANRTGTYTVEVTHSMGGCSATDDIFLYFLINDLSVTDVDLPATICDRDGIITTVTVTNSGNTNPGSGTKFMLGIKSNGELLREQEFSLTSIMGAGSEREFTFAEPVLYQPAADPSTVKFFVSWLQDVRDGNDTLIVSNAIKSSPDIDLGGGNNDTLGIESFPHQFSLTSGYSSYLWNDGATGTEYTANSTGWYKVNVSGSNGCVTRDSVFLKIGTGIFQFAADNPDVKVYPNPAENMLNVEFSAGAPGLYKLRMLNISGQTVFSRNYEAFTEVKDALDLSALPRGMYVLILQNEKGRYMQQVILQ